MSRTSSAFDMTGVPVGMHRDTYPCNVCSCSLVYGVSQGRYATYSCISHSNCTAPRAPRLVTLATSSHSTDVPSAVDFDGDAPDTGAATRISRGRRTSAIGASCKQKRVAVSAFEITSRIQAASVASSGKDLGSFTAARKRPSAIGNILLNSTVSPSGDRAQIARIMFLPSLTLSYPRIFSRAGVFHFSFLVDHGNVFINLKASYCCEGSVTAPFYMNN